MNRLIGSFLVGQHCEYMSPVENEQACGSGMMGVAA